MPYWDHEEKITRSVFTMDRMFSFYVKTPLQGPAKVFFRLSGQYCHLSQESPVWGANGHKIATNVPLKLLSNLLYYDISF